MSYNVCFSIFSRLDWVEILSMFPLELAKCEVLVTSSITDDSNNPNHQFHFKNSVLLCPEPLTNGQELLLSRSALDFRYENGNSQTLPVLIFHLEKQEPTLTSEVVRMGSLPGSTNYHILPMKSWSHQGDLVLGHLVLVTVEQEAMKSWPGGTLLPCRALLTSPSSLVQWFPTIGGISHYRRDEVYVLTWPKTTHSALTPPTPSLLFSEPFAVF